MAYRPKDTQERILHRLKIVRGHLNKIISMVEKGGVIVNHPGDVDSGALNSSFTTHAPSSSSGFSGGSSGGGGGSW